MKINSYRVRPVGGEKELEFVVDARVVETIERQETPWEHGVTVDTAMPGSLAIVARRGEIIATLTWRLEDAETAESFGARIFDRVGLRPEQIPDAPASVMLGGSIACSSPHGVVVLVDHTHQDDDGVDHYARCAMVDRGAELAPASVGATGIITD
jgi:hypothetical protein